MEKLRVLVVDDESLIRMDITEMLEDAGYDVVAEGENGAQAIELARKHSPDVIVMDVKMPVMDGISASKVIADEDIAPVILLTAFSQEDIVDKASDAGVIAYLVKPIREEQLFPAIRVAVQRFRDLKNLGLELDKLKDSLETRKLLDRAKGILMTAHGLNEQDAYRRMQQYSMSKRISLKELAEMIISAAEKKKK
ncbi:MAG: response regulator [Phascolarctobacterium sp.]|nr:response regulator [Phascolarctobacterium sp.]